MKNNEIKVLLIEDEEGDQYAFKDLVKEKQLPYYWKIAGSVAEARSILTTESFDVVVSDYLLGDGTSFDVFDLIEKTPIIFITGAGSETVAVKAMKAGVYDYIVKDQDYKYIKNLPETIEGAYKHMKSQIPGNETRIKIEDLKRITKEINVYCAKFTGAGMIIPLSYTSLSIFSSDEEARRFIVYQSTYLQVVLGPPDIAPEGLFGPFPMRGHPDKLSFLYSFKNYDSSITDPRLEQAHAVIVIVFQTDLEPSLPPRKKIEEIITPLLQNITDLAGIPKNLASQVWEKFTQLLELYI
ncbi:MAG: response regulator [Candidatus Hodarchaeota archaeon]